MKEKRKAEVRRKGREMDADGRTDGRLEDGVFPNDTRAGTPFGVGVGVPEAGVGVEESRWVTGLAGPVVATYARVRIGRRTPQRRAYTHVTRTRRTPTWPRAPERILQPERIIHPRYWSKYSVAFTYES